MQISFFGAAQEVSGSNILIENSSIKLLLDCGLFQGSKLAQAKNFSPFGYDPSKIDFIVICHAHLDHVGRLPRLTRAGFKGKIFATAPTKALTRLVLEDNEKLMREEAKKNNHPTLYQLEDIDTVMSLFECLNYHQSLEIKPGISLTLKNAGHILGSAIAVLNIDNKKIVYTSDLGNTPSLLLDPPDTVDYADIIICESTYGGRIHEDINRRHQKLSEIISSSIAQSAVLLIPSFAIERTQELLHDIDHFCSIQNCQKPHFYLDSPLAEKVTKVFKNYPEYLSKNIRTEHDSDFFGLDRVTLTTSVEQSKMINEAPKPKIIIAGSGMMNGGRILFHAKRYLEDAQNTLLFIGYQANGTLGRKIFDGAASIKIHGEIVKIRAQIKSIGSYSAHADMAQILDWLSPVSGLKCVYITHGESDQASILAEQIQSQLQINALIPKFAQKYQH